MNEQCNIDKYNIATLPDDVEIVLFQTFSVSIAPMHSMGNNTRILYSTSIYICVSLGLAVIITERL